MKTHSAARGPQADSSNIIEGSLGNVLPADGQISRLRSYIESTRQGIVTSGLSPAVDTLIKYAEAIIANRNSGLQTGVLLCLPKIDTIVIGDLHGRLDNLNRILEWSNAIKRLESAAAQIVFDGDLIHPELGSFSYMESSFELLQQVMALKVRFPDRVFVNLGNHDLLNNDQRKEETRTDGKHEVNQSQVFKDSALGREGYGLQWTDFYSAIVTCQPMVILRAPYVIVHAAPIRTENGPLKSIDEIAADQLMFDCEPALQNFATQCALYGRPIQYADSRFPQLPDYGYADVEQFLSACGPQYHMLLVGHCKPRNGGFDRLYQNLLILHSGMAGCAYAEIIGDELKVSGHEFMFED